MKRLLFLLLALLALCLPARALDIPAELDGAVPDELLEGAREEESLLQRGAAYLWETLRGAVSGAAAASLRSAVSLPSRPPVSAVTSSGSFASTAAAAAVSSLRTRARTSRVACAAS